MTDRWNRLLPPVSAPTAHLDDIEIAGSELDADAEKHLANCGWCRTRYQQLSSEHRSDFAELLVALDSATIPDTTLSSASSLALPATLLHYLDADPADVPNVAPAQLWRLVWGGRTQLAVTVERDSWWVTVAPVSSDVRLADEYTAICDAAASSLATESAVFMRAATAVPVYTLAAYLGEFHPSTTDSPEVWLGELYRAAVDQTPTPVDVPTGPPLMVDDWDRQETLDTLLDEMRWFAAAAAEIDDEDTSEADPLPDTTGVASANVVDLLRSRGSNLEELAAATGLEPGRLVDLAQGGGQPTAHEQRALAKYFRVSISLSDQEALRRRALLEVISEPRCRRLWEVPASTGWNGSREGGTPRRLIESLLNEKVAARAVTGTGHAHGADLNAWRTHWREVVAMMLS